ncbi:hypothetical protein ATDW_30540 [Asticcacaulis sp. DW145]|uniref:hypothetical protein n=1 Tax=Asticcacaulis sp. DW145 TaxID=3095608 RepID=UPI00308A66BF|nr:hypothetical protein ATDW_30540 [Asticcacaulis sp. DW145]
MELMIEKGLLNRQETAIMLSKVADVQSGVMDNVWAPSNEGASKLLQMLSDEQMGKLKRGE